MPEPYSALGFAYCTAFCYLEGEVLALMDWHAHSNPLPSHSCPSNAMDSAHCDERSGNGGCLLGVSKNWRLP